MTSIRQLSRTRKGRRSVPTTANVLRTARSRLRLLSLTRAKRRERWTAHSLLCLLARAERTCMSPPFGQTMCHSPPHQLPIALWRAKLRPSRWARCTRHRPATGPDPGAVVSSPLALTVRMRKMRSSPSIGRCPRGPSPPSGVATARPACQRRGRTSPRILAMSGIYGPPDGWQMRHASQFIFGITQLAVRFPWRGPCAQLACRLGWIIFGGANAFPETRLGSDRDDLRTFGDGSRRRLRQGGSGRRIIDPRSRRPLFDEWS